MHVIVRDGNLVPTSNITIACTYITVDFSIQLTLLWPQASATIYSTARSNVQMTQNDENQPTEMHVSCTFERAVEENNGPLRGNSTNGLEICGIIELQAMGSLQSGRTLQWNYHHSIAHMT